MYQIFTIFFLVVLNGLMPWILSRFKFREHLVLLSSVPLVFASMMLVLQISSLIDSDLSFARVQQTTGIIFLLFLSIYTGNKTHQDRFSKAKLQEMITLGRSVQDLLLPKRLEETFKSLSYAFAYEPFEGNMSGDWIKYWKTNDGRHHFLLGDVTGKGPQAALAVSIISTVVDRCIRLDNDAKSALIQINRTLFSLLKGSVGSTASGASIGQNRELKLFNTAGIGWILQDAKTVRHILGRSSILGQKNLVEISECTVKEHQWTLIYTFSDGVCNGPRAIKHLTRRLLDLNVNPLKSQDLKQEVLKIANYIGDPQDDKTLLIIKLGLADAA
jgi:serine phosphatase RsbU (regulator of sigma subunit)